MNSNNDLENTKDFTPEIGAGDVVSIDDFIKQLEAKERDLHISSEMVIEIEEPKFDDTNLPGFAATEVPIETPKIKGNINFRQPNLNGNF